MVRPVQSQLRATSSRRRCRIASSRSARLIRDGEQAHPQRPRDELRQRVRSAHLAAAAEYQVDRLARTTGKSASEIRDIIKQCTEQPQFGFLGDARVNVLKVNLMLDGVL